MNWGWRELPTLRLRCTQYCIQACRSTEVTRGRFDVLGNYERLPFALLGERESGIGDAEDRNCRARLPESFPQSKQFAYPQVF